MTGGWERVEVAVCTDCVLTLATDLPDDLTPGRAAAITTGLDTWAADGWRLEPGDGDEHFSWARCQGCGDGRGGDRHQAWAIRPDPQLPTMPPVPPGRWATPTRTAAVSVPAASRPAPAQGAHR